MNKIFPVSSILTYNITERSQFTKGTIYMGKENIQENNIRITSKATNKKVKNYFRITFKAKAKKMTIRVA